MTANVSIITNRRKNVLCTTSIALKYSPESNGKKYKQQGIWPLEGNQPVRIPVTEGASDDSHVEIISNKVRVGDKVIVGSTGGKGSKAASTNSNKRRGGPPGMF